MPFAPRHIRCFVSIEVFKPQMKPDNDNNSILQAKFNGAAHEFKAGVSIPLRARA